MAAQRPEPDLTEWRKLYDETARFCRARPWDYLDSEDLFGVQDPDTGEVVYCSVMGAAGIQYGLLAHRGPEGLRSHALVSGGQLDPDEALLGGNALVFSLGNREEMAPADRAVHAALGVKFRGRGAWPLFRRHRPIYLAVPLQPGEAALLALCMEQCRLFADEVRAAGEFPENGNNTLPLRSRNAAGEWETTAMVPQLEHYIPVFFTESLLDELRETAPLTTQTWEARHVAIVPMAGEEGQDDYWARALLCVEHELGFILTPGIMEPQDSVQDAFLHIVQSTEFIPHKLLVTSALLAAELSPITDQLDIDVELVEELPFLDEAEAAMKSAFRG